MVCGVIVQLVSYGNIDVYLTGNPEITHFKSIYRKNSNFAIETIEEVFKNLNNSNRLGCKLSKKGDLLKDVILELDISKPILENSDGFVKRPGLTIINYVELEIGGIVVNKLTGEWIDIYYQMCMNNDQFTKYKCLVNGTLFNNFLNIINGNDTFKFYIPLPFFFTKDIGMSLPLILLEHNEVSVNVVFKNTTSIIKSNSNTNIIEKPIIEDIKLLCDYIFLDENEKKCFYKSSKDYVIEQIQYSSNNEFLKNDSCANIDLNFNHPCKEIIWICQDSWNLVQNSNSPILGQYNPYCYSAGESIINMKSGGDIIQNVELILNNVKRFKKRDITYFRIVQPYQHHNGCYYNNIYNKEERGYIYSYSFALTPDNSAPSGTCNFSRVSNAKLILSINNNIIRGNKYFIRVFAVNYNVLHFENGMGYLIYK